MKTLTGNWHELGAQARRVREAVFVHEQGISRQDEWDDADARATHAVVLNPQGIPVATGRLLLDADGQAHIGRMAVLKAWRGQGLGLKIMRALEQAARQQGRDSIVLSAQCSAQKFYERQAYRPEGEVYEEVGIAHVLMRKRLHAKALHEQLKRKE